MQPRALRGAMRVTRKAIAFWFCGLSVLAACDSSRAGPGSPDGGVTPSPADGGSDCVQVPTTAEEILNRCPRPGTERVDKQPNLPLLRPDGTLPPLE